MSSNFKNYSKYYNLLYGDKNYTAEVNYVEKCIRDHLPIAKSILEFGSGTGGHGLLLQKRGFDIYGIEQSEGMVAEAMKKGLPCEVADISNFKLNRQFDVVISLFHVISYLTSNESLVNTFRNAYRQLNDGGIFIFDFWYTPAVYIQDVSIRVKRMANNELAVTRIAEPEMHYIRNVVDVNFTIIAKDVVSGQVSEFTECHPMRHFSIPEIHLLAEFTGFTVVKSEEFLTGKEPSPETWGVCFILKKN